MISSWGFRRRQKRQQLHVQPLKLQKRSTSLPKNLLMSLWKKRRTKRKNQKLLILCTRIKTPVPKRRWQGCPGTLSLQKRQGRWRWRLLLLQASWLFMGAIGCNRQSPVGLIKFRRRLSNPWPSEVSLACCSAKSIESPTQLPRSWSTIHRAVLVGSLSEPSTAVTLNVAALGESASRVPQFHRWMKTRTTL